jgi:hypothetical protein
VDQEPRPEFRSYAISAGMRGRVGAGERLGAGLGWRAYAVSV